MRSLHFVCLLAILFSQMALAQSSPLGDTRGEPQWGVPPHISQMPQGKPLAHRGIKKAPTFGYPQASAVNFAPAVVYESGGVGARSVVVADVNGDGKPDLLVANNCGNSNNCNSGSVGVLLGNGDGTFQAALSYDSGAYDSMALAVADVNGDGKPDLLIGSFCSSIECSDLHNAVSVSLGNGDGTFQAPVTYATNGTFGTWSVASRDVNADGTLDLLAANGGGGQIGLGGVGVLLGYGDGTFQTAVDYDTGWYDARFVAVADVNGDGKPDLLVANGDFQVDINAIRLYRFLRFRRSELRRTPHRCNQSHLLLSCR